MKSYQKYRWSALVVFFVFELIHNVDKLLLGPLTTPIMETFNINEAQMGAVTTAALIVGTALYPLWGYLYDRFARPKLLALAALIWGLTTMLSASAANYVMFVITRASTGIDDTAYPGVESMVSDYFSPRVRSKAYGFLKLAPPLGSLLALILSMTLAGQIGWRNIYYITGSAGIILALMTFFVVKDPPRGNAEPELANLDQPSVFKFNWKEAKQIIKKPTMSFLLVSGFFGVFPWTVLTFWIYRYLGTERNFSTNETLILMASVILVMSIGYMVSGALADLMFKKTKSGRLIISLIGISLAFVFLILAVTSPLDNHLLFSILIVTMAFFMTFAGPQTPATIADITLPEVRSTALSIQYLVENSGAALAPFLAGLIAVKANLGQAIFIVSFAWLIAAILITFAAFFVPRDHARMHQQLSLRAAAQEPAKGETE